MPAKIFSCAVNGLEGELIEVEADILPSQLSSFHIVGLGDTAVQEAKERVRAAIKNSQCQFPWRHKVVNLAPADLKKQGPSFDLAMAVAILVADKQIMFTEEFKDSLFVGELSLEGHLKPVTGILSIAIFAKEKKFKKIFLPSGNAYEAGLIPDIQIIPVQTLKQLINHLNQELEITPFSPLAFKKHQPEADNNLDMSFVRGQEQAKRALEIAAAGAHNLFFNGPPGSGKTLLARTFQTILPDLTLDESLEITKIYSVSGLLPPNQPLIFIRPFRSVHHTASAVSIVGGGTNPKPGEISLAHKGVLFLDEIAEFPSPVLEVLRQPLEDKIITIGRASGTLTYPAHFTLIGAMNPCPCGYSSDPEKECTCAPNQVTRYRKKISGPLLDRIDLYVEVPRLKFEKLASEKEAEKSIDIKNRVEIARQIQLDRFKDLKIKTNSEMNSQEVRKHCDLDQESLLLLKQAVIKFQLSGRAFYRILKTSRTIADLEQKEKITSAHVAEALQYRKKEDI